MKANHFRWIALSFLLVVAGEVFAQSSVDSRVQRLEETIQILERRVASLETQLREQSSASSVAIDKVNWRKLKHGMSERDVESLLGSPSKVDANQVFFTWYYGDRGYVRFDTTSRKVDGWREP